MYNYNGNRSFLLRENYNFRKLGRGARSVSVSLLRYYIHLYNTYWDTKDTFASNVFQLEYQVTIKLSVNMFIIGTM